MSSVAPPPSSPLANFRGSLGDISVFDLYRQIYLSRQSATLELRQPGVVKKISFRHGSIVFATTNQESERLGTLLLKEEKILPSELDDIIRQCRTGKRFGQVALQRGMITPSELDAYIRRHQSEVACSTLDWDGGTFELVEALDSSYEDVFVELSTADIIFEGVRRIKGEGRIRDLLGSLDETVCLASDPLLRFQRISLDPQEAYVVSRVEGGTTIAEICRISALDETSTLKAVLGLIMTGILDRGTKCAEVRQPVLRPEITSRSAKEYSSPQSPDPELMTELRQLRNRFESCLLYEILDVRSTASVEDIKASYFRLAKRYHPDRYSHTASAREIEIGESVFRKISDAYRVLSDPVQRTEYDEKTANEKPKAASPAAPEPKLRSPIQAVGRRAFEEGVRLYNGGNYPAALEKLKEAVGIDDTMAPYRFYLAKTLSHLPQRQREAEFHFRLAIHQAPWNAQYQFELAQFYEHAGLSGRAQGCYETAFRLDPALTRAANTPPANVAPRNRGLFAKLFTR